MGQAISSTVVSGWAWLPSDLLYLIVEKLIPITDYIQLGAVCKNWQSVARHQKHQRLKSCHKQLPMLMVPSKHNCHERHGLYSVTKGKTCSFELHVPYNKRLCGSSNGWLACVDENLEVTLLNPSTKRTIRLPPFAQVPQPIHKQAYRSDDYIKKVVSSADPSLFPNDYEAVALFNSNGTRVAHIKSGDHGWTHIDQTIIFFYGLNQVIEFDDVIYYRGQFLAASREGGVFAINVGKDPTYKPHVSIVVPMDQGIDDQAYLVESSRGDLLLVRKFQSLNYVECYTETLSFKVFKLFSDCGDKIGSERIEEIDSIGNDAFFLGGNNHSMCVSALDFPDCHPNSIYFCIDKWVGYDEVQEPLGMAVFNFENRKFGTNYYCSSPSQKYMPPSIWILPTMV
ncbi:F-box protein At2g26160-like [Prunus avium]|uniref:F-box protein At2g26160-like n=1 Tax=Prunus avium TaxID=42229 RepID=A0A6P5T349_PRUAV|nr:F-box protein At2g26160-like [Prunus avium]